ncbi:MAG: pyrimidine 5'-nucleotidase [Beijerinckiaceae bacterium]|nr:pyrimidine 5'-nucleotidase [Beijerinckiaceae bacterium]
MNAPTPPRALTPHAFTHVTTWVFDLDNTLYPPGAGLWPKIDARITHYISDLHGLDGISARALQKFYYERYGTTLRGLMEDHLIDPAAFLAFVHDIDRSAIVPNPILAAAIAALPGRKLVLTNGSRHHAVETARALGVGHLFEDFFGIEAGDLLPKPEPETYQRFLTRHDVDPLGAVMFEDIPRNLLVPKALGMTTVLVVPPPGTIEDREAFETIGGVTPAHIDFVTNDLAGFLQSIAPE